jgi:hypothetical protein
LRVRFGDYVAVAVVLIVNCLCHREAP